MANKNAKGPPKKVTDEMLEHFAKIWDKNRKWAFREVYNFAETSFRDMVKDVLTKEDPGLSGTDLDDEIKERTPTESAFRKALKRKDRYPALMEKLDTDPKNKAWNLGNLLDLDLPAPALSVLLEIQEERGKKQKKPLTIREAWWAAHLCEVIRTTKVHPRTQVIDFWASEYASKQRFSDMLDQHPLDTTELDNIFRNYAEAYARFSVHWSSVQEEKGFEAAAGLFSSLLEQDAIVYSRDKIDSDRDLSLRELADQEKQLEKVKKALQEKERLWGIIQICVDKFALKSSERTQQLLSRDPKFKTYMQNRHGPDFEQQNEKKIAELKKDLSKLEKEAQNERPHSQER